MIYNNGDEIKFRNGDDILVGWVEGPPIFTEQEEIVGYMVACPQFQGAVNINNVIEEE
jgi:hypothetical protein